MPLRLLLVACLVTLAAPVAAVPTICGTNQICYDDVLSATYDWIGINETIQSADDAPGGPGDGLYGAPTGGGTSLVFMPTLYSASSSAGSAFDTTHSTLNATLMANGSSVIEGIRIFEMGSYDLAGLGGGATGIQGTIGGQITVLEIGGVAVPSTVLNIDGNDGILTVVSSGTTVPGGFFDVLPNAGSHTWSIEYLLDLTSLGDVTKVEIQLNDILSAASEVESSAGIEKSKVIVEVIPEPGTALLLALGLVALATASRRP